jgi:hypothetical protein
MRGTSCPEMETHLFEARYHHTFNPKTTDVIEKIIRLLLHDDEVRSKEELDEIRKLITDVKYVRDICSRCGETRERIGE